MATIAKAAGFDQIMRFHPSRDAEINLYRCGVRVQILEAEDLEAVRERPSGWATCAMDDGKILALGLVDDADIDAASRIGELPDVLRCYGVEDAEDPEWAADAREFREILAKFIERLPKAKYLTLRVGGNGTGEFEIGYGEAGLVLAFGRDSSS